MCMSGGCGGGNSNAPRSSTSRPYTASQQPKKMYHRPSGSSNTGSRSSTFGTAKIKFSGKGK